MAAHWRDQSAFRADPSAAAALTPSRRQSIALLAVLLLVAGAVAVAAYVVRPDRARSFDLFHGSLFLADQVAPVAIDLATGKPTMRLVGADKQVGVTGSETLSVVPVDNGTLLLNSTTGEFNMVDNTGFVIKHDGGGVPLPQRAGASSTIGVGSGQFAYIERTGAGGTDVFLVDQSTVQAAIGARKGVTARASASMAQVGTSAHGGAASANGALWMLVGSSATASTRAIRELSVPAGSSTGAQLTSAARGSVTGAAAIGTATSGTGTAVAVASAGSLIVFRANGTRTRHLFPAPPGVDSILPAGEGADRAAFLTHSSAGWSVVSVAADGSDLRGPTAIPGLSTNTDLVTPAASADGLYTMDRASGRIYRIGYDGTLGSVPGIASYPIARTGTGKAAEAGGFGDAYVIARGTRVVFDSPSHVKAVAVFADGSQAPTVIQKNDAVDVSAAGGAEALTKTTGAPLQPGKAPKPGSPKPKAQAVQPVNNHIDCRTVTQKPHVPQITQVTPGSRSVELGWTYPLLDNQDCVPSTYVISVQLRSPAAPQPPASAQVQSQTGTNLTGLYPSTQYELTLTAYINGSGTSSQPVYVTTGPEGPAAPTNVAVSADSAGNWHVSWNACGSVSAGCVSAASWNVVPSYCDGLGLSAAPTPLSVTADPTSVAQPPAVYPGGSALLGRGLRFQIEGVGSQGAIGAPSANSPCVYSWSPPDQGAIAMTASTSNTTSFGGYNPATVTLHFAHGAVVDSGGVGAQYTFHLTGGGQTRTIGPTSQTAVTFPNAVAAGASYTATADITPPRHPGARITLGPAQVQTSSQWPAITVGSATVTASPGDPSQGTLNFALSGISSQAAGGERFDLVSPQIVCGNTGVPVSALTGVDPAAPITAHVSGISPTMYNSSCTLQLALTESPGSLTTPPYFGGTTSPTVTGAVRLPQQSPTTVVDPASFGASWQAGPDSSGNSVADVRIPNDLIASFLTYGWSEVISDGVTGDCGSDTAAHTTSIEAKQSCVQENGPAENGWHVTISWSSYLDGNQHSTTIPISGTPPTYQAPPPPCTVSQSNFSAQWGLLPAPLQLQLNYTAGSDQLAGCSGWSYQVVVPPGTSGCTAPDLLTGAPTIGAFTFLVTCPPATVPPVTGWQVSVTYTGPSGSNTFLVPVSGSPPS